MGELGLLTVGTCSEQGGKVKKVERKMLELRNMRALAARILRMSSTWILKSPRLLALQPSINVAVVL